MYIFIGRFVVYFYWSFTLVETAGKQSLSADGKTAKQVFSSYIVCFLVDCFFGRILAFRSLVDHCESVCLFCSYIQDLELVTLVSLVVLFVHSGSGVIELRVCPPTERPSSRFYAKRE